VVVGSGIGGVKELSAGVESLVTKGPSKISPFSVPLSIPNMASALVAIDAGIGFLGPNYSVSAACATGNHCIHSAADQIRLGRADVMLAGGAEAAIAPAGLGGLAALGALSRRNADPATASRPWDRDRDGFVMGEGAGVLVVFFISVICALHLWHWHMETDRKLWVGDGEPRACHEAWRAGARRVPGRRGDLRRVPCDQPEARWSCCFAVYQAES
jgi:hypothetical protein